MNTQEIREKLAAYFPQEDVEWKPQATNGNRALAVAYIDARCVMDRLDAAVGPENWSDDYQTLDDGCVICRLSVRCGAEWVTKCDVGGESDQKDTGDKRKSALSDALKRAAVKWGVGRYLYSLPKQWVDWDPQKKQFAKRPQLPAWAIPPGAKTPPATARTETPESPRAGNGHGKAKELPKNGTDLLKRAESFNLDAYQKGYIREVGWFPLQVRLFGEAEDYRGEVEQWTEEQVVAGFRHMVALYRKKEAEALAAKKLTEGAAP